MFWCMHESLLAALYFHLHTYGVEVSHQNNRIYKPSYPVVAPLLHWDAGTLGI